MQIPKFSNYRFDNKEEVSTNVELLSRNFNNNFDMLSGTLSSLKSTVSKTNKYMQDLPVITGEEQDPNGNYTGEAGTIYRNTKGGAGVTLWVKETEEDVKTGWAPIYGGVPKQYVSSYCTTNSVTSSADTWTDVASMTITLTPGRWRIGYSAAQYLRNTAGGGSYGIAGNTAIRTSSGVVLTNTIRGREFYSVNSGYYMTTTSCAEDIIDITEETTYVFSHKCGRAAAQATSTIYASSFDSTLTDPDNKSVIFAELIESYSSIINTNSLEKDYGMFSHSGNPNTTYINAGDKIPNNYTIQGNGSIIADTANRTYQLKANKLYKLSSEVLATFSSTGGHAAFKWYDEETSSYIGSATYMRPLTLTTSIGITSNSVAFLRTTKNQSVSLRIESQTSLSGTYGKNGSYSWFLIEEIQRF